MSPRAACWLETLGFRDVCDYVAGKQDWLARSLPTEGATRAPRAQDVVREDVATCRLEDWLTDVKTRLERSPYGFAVVVSRTGVVLGRLRRSAVDASARTVGEVMEAGPGTVRPDSDLASLVE